MRAGASALSLLAVPLNINLLCALQEEDRSLAELSHAVGLPPASTLRSYLRALTDWGVLERRQEAGFPGSVSYRLTDAGEDLVRTGEVLRRWLEAAPRSEMAYGSPVAKRAVKALVDGWDVAIVRALAARPCTLTELARAIPQVNYPTLERRLTAMRKVGQVEARRNGNARGTPYGASPWLREGVVPLLAAMAWERHHAAPMSAPIARLDVEGAFLLVLPLLRVDTDLSGSCRMAVELRGEGAHKYAGATVSVEHGRVAASARLGSDADAWVTGTPLDWYRWVDGHHEEVQIGGDHRLAMGLTDALRGVLTPGQRV